MTAAIAASLAASAAASASGAALRANANDHDEVAGEDETLRTWLGEMGPAKRALTLLLMTSLVVGFGLVVLALLGGLIVWLVSQPQVIHYGSYSHQPLFIFTDAARPFLVTGIVGFAMTQVFAIFIPWVR